MSNNEEKSTFFQKALAHFTHEFANGDIIRRYVDRGYSITEIKAKLELQQTIANQRKEELSQLENIPKPLSAYEDANEMQVTVIGDSVTLAALDALYDVFPNGYMDAVFGRTIYEGINALVELEEEGKLGNVTVFSLGTNCQTFDEDYEALIEHSDGRPVFFISTYGVTNDSNQIMRRVAGRHANAFYIDWETPALQHQYEWILDDHLHPNDEGSYAYAELIRSYINRYVILLEREKRKQLVP